MNFVSIIPSKTASIADLYENTFSDVKNASIKILMPAAAINAVEAARRP